MNFHELIVLILASVGTAFMLFSSIGVYRFPDVFARMHALGMASTLGISGLLLAAGIFFLGGDTGNVQNQFLRMVALILLFFITAPIATTSMARAAHRTLKAETSFQLECDAITEHQQQREEQA